ncbi:DUF2917 domain-containing protein [Methylibium sp.]|uniref:DUF2917 domain-containing protein n=1 Tax=Methylibium sp. TaxID=2067992 RepID=UPI003D0A9493
MNETCLITLPAGRIARLQRAAGLWVEVRSGLLWLTEAGDPQDHFLRAGERHRIAGRGLVILEPQPPADGEAAACAAGFVLRRRWPWSFASLWCLPAVPVSRPLRWRAPELRPAGARRPQRDALSTA